MADMTYRQLGDSGLTVSTVGIGCNNMGRRLDKDATRAVVDAALDVGVSFFDTADVYGSEPGASEDLLGQALQGRRDEVVIATKFGFDVDPSGKENRGAALNSRPEHIKQVAEASLKRLRTDTIDLFYQHRVDPSVPIEEVAGAFTIACNGGERLVELVREGRSESSHLADTTHMREFGLKVLETKKSLLAFGQVAYKSSENSSVAQPRFAHR